MGYAEHLINFLAPLRIYDLKSGRHNRCELDSEGLSLDYVQSVTDEIIRETLPVTARSYGLTLYEKLLGISGSGDALKRSDAVCRLLRVNGDSFTRAALEDAAAACGVPAEIREVAGEERVVIRLHGTERDIPDIQAAFSMLRSLLPAHLDADFVFTYITWDEFEAYFSVFDALDTCGLSWDGIEALTDHAV